MNINKNLQINEVATMLTFESFKDQKHQRRIYTNRHGIVALVRVKNGNFFSPSREIKPTLTVLANVQVKYIFHALCDWHAD